MKNKMNKPSFLLGVLVTILVISLTTPVMAAASKTIEVFTGVKIYVDDKQLNPTDANGNPVDVFIYNGTTYLPVRAVSDAVGKVVQWDGATQSVYLGKHSSDRPAAYLSKMDYFTQSGAFITDGVETDNLGNEHINTMCLSSYNSTGSITYKLNGQYRRLTGTLFQQYWFRDYETGGTLVISGDGRELWRGHVAAGIDPVDFDVDITGVLELTLEFPSGGYGRADYSAIGEVALWT